MHISTPVSDKLNHHLEKYLSYAYAKIGYKTDYEKILVDRARVMIDAGKLDAIMIAEKEVEQKYTNILRVPVMLVKGSLVLYCNNNVNCQTEVLNNPSNIIGIILGHSMAVNFMKTKQASAYTVINAVNLDAMLHKGRLDYILTINVEPLGNISGFDDSLYQQIEVFRSEGYHYIHKKHAQLLPELTQALQLAIEKYGPLNTSDKISSH